MLALLGSFSRPLGATSESSRRSTSERRLNVVAPPRIDAPPGATPWSPARGVAAWWCVRACARPLLLGCSTSASRAAGGAT
eukprot:147990-Chlamydomonas_euryale.AAC.1